MHFTHSFKWNHQAKYPFTPGTRNSSRTCAFPKARVVVGPLCLMQLWTVFGLAFSTAHKNQCTEQAVSYSYHKQPYPKSALSIYLSNFTNLNLSKVWIQNIWPYDTNFAASFWPGLKTTMTCLQGSFLVMRWPPTSTVNWTGIFMFGEHEILMPPSSMQEIHCKWSVLCHFKEEGLWPCLFHGKYCHE